jgi:hypothetical protein
MLCQTLLRQASSAPSVAAEALEVGQQRLWEKAVLQGKQRAFFNVLAGVVGQRLPP